ncbi:hypothetical protein M0802_002649 [Mischocyttarus mexicanus]|nr:hypothetical protein M0802_002649 [Mischocyttarus mexicanus]
MEIGRISTIVVEASSGCIRGHKETTFATAAAPTAAEEEEEEGIESWGNPYWIYVMSKTTEINDSLKDTNKQLGLSSTRFRASSPSPSWKRSEERVLVRAVVKTEVNVQAAPVRSSTRGRNDGRIVGQVVFLTSRKRKAKLTELKKCNDNDDDNDHVDNDDDDDDDDDETTWYKKKMICHATFNSQQT